MIEGFATREGTQNFAKKFEITKSNNARTIHGLTLSNVGIGTYLGNPDTETDSLVTQALIKSIKSGINVIDTAINYRSQKAERSVGKALSHLIEENIIKRDEVFISTKNGYVTNDADVKQEFWEYVNNEYVKKGVIQANDISSGYHCMSIPYLEAQLIQSRKNLGLECIDLMYIHNAVEGQIQDLERKEFLEKLHKVFEFFEIQRKKGTIQFYGMATWECFRVPKENPQYLSLTNVMEIAREAGGTSNGFKFIQLPYNLYFDQAFMTKNQSENGKDITILESAIQNNIGVFTSVPLMQSRLLAPGVIPEFGNLKASLRAIQFVRSTPGVVAPLVGHKTPEHTEENLEIMKIPPLSSIEFEQLVKTLTSR